MTDGKIQERILEQVREERRFQDSKHPLPDGFPKDIRLAILLEEAGEVAKAICERKPIEVREELVQLAAVAIRWLENMDRESIEEMDCIASSKVRPTEDEILMYEAATGKPRRRTV